MARAGPFVVLLALLLAKANADVCSAGCTKGSNNGFQPQNTYVYWLEGNANVFLSGADNQETGVKITAQATVVGLGNCANLLKISSLMITGPNGTNYNKPNNIEKPVRFTLEDGVLGSQICAEEDDSQTSLNIKRAILSMLQTNDKHDNEVDIFGICPTSYNVRKDNNGMVVSKTKNLNTCAKREQGIVNILNPGANIPQSNVMQSSLNVDIVMKNYIVEKAEAHEEYLYIPFSVGSAGARASVTTKITLRSTNKGNVDAKCVVPKTIVFEAPKPETTGHNNIANIQVALQKVSQTMANVVDANSASVFAGLIRVLRASSKDDISNIYGQIKSGSSLKNNKLSRRVFLDALFRTGTGESIEFTINLIKGNDLTPLEKNLALLSLTTILHATSGSVKAATELLDAAHLPNEVYLGVGSLAGVYCREHSCHGKSNPQNEITQLSQKLNTKLGNCRATSRSAETTIIFALKAIKNIHHIDDCLIDKLAMCASDKSVSTRVRVAALETYGADPCIPKLKQTAINILKDVELDSELRIKAYLSLLKCPCNKVAGELKTLMESEPIYQVGSFIASSLRNIKASANPAYDAAKQFFGNIKIVKQFPIDVRKYSQNYEMSIEQGMFGLGSFAEANVIYSQNSFVPRSSTLNLTTELFGSNVNLLEVGYRQGNLERFLEQYFGPHGVLNTETPQKLYNNAKSRADSILDKLKERMEKTRGKRSVKQETTQFGKNLKTGIEEYSGDLELDVFVRLMGSDTLFLSTGCDKPASVESLIDKFFDYIDSGLTDAKDFTHEIRSHMLLLDLETAYPTSMGVALKLNGEGASTTKMEFSSNTDFKKCLNDPKNAQIDMKLVPSANVELSVSIMFDADVISTGLKVKSSLHTSTGAHVVAKLLNDGKGFDMKVDLPAEKEEIISLDHDIIFVARPRGDLDIETPLKFDQKNWSKMNGCFDQLSNTVGLTLCGSLSVPWLLSYQEKNKPKISKMMPKGPLSGPAKLSVYLEKDDLKGFHIVGAVDDKKEDQKTMELTFEALGTKKARKVSFKTNVVNRDDLRSVKATFVAPGKQISATAAITNNQKEKSLMAEWKYDQEKYLGKVGANVAAARGKVVFTPIFDVEYPGAPKDVKMTGNLVMESKGDGQRVTFNDLTLGSKDFNYHLNGWLYFDAQSNQCDLKIKSNEDVATLIGKTAVKRINDDDKTFSTLWEFTNTKEKNVNFVFSLDGENTKKLNSAKLSLVHGPDPKSKVSRIDYEYALATNEVEDVEELDIAWKEKFAYPMLQLKVEDELVINPKRYRAMLLGSFETKTLDIDTEIKTEMKKEDDMFLKFKTLYNKKGIDSQFLFEQTDKDKGQFSAKLEFPPKLYEASGLVNYMIDDDNTNVGTVATLKLHGKSEPIRVDTGLIQNKNLFNAHTKLSVGTVDYTDMLLKIQTQPSVSGNAKIMIKDIISGQGQLKMDPNNKGNIVLVLDMLKTARKVKVEGNFMVGDPEVTANIDIYYDFNKDKAKKVTLNTNSKIGEHSIDSTNFVAYDNHKVDLIVKATAVGAFVGTQNGFITISNSEGQSVKLQFDRKMEENDEKLKGYYDSTLTYVPDKSSKPYTVGLKGNLNAQKGFVMEEHLSFINPSGEDLHLKTSAKMEEKDKRESIDGKVEINGALWPNALSVAASCDYNEGLDNDKGDLKYRVKGSYGPKSSIDLSGSLNYEAADNENFKIWSDIGVGFSFPLEKAQNVKYSSTFYLFVPKDESYIETKSSMNALLNTDAYKYDFEYLLGEKKGNSKLVVTVPNQEKFSVETNFDIKEANEKIASKSMFNLQYGKNQQLYLSVDGNRTPGKEGSYKFKLLLPTDLGKAKEILYDMNYKKTNVNGLYIEGVVFVDGEKHTATLNTDFTNPKSVLIDFKSNCPHLKPYAVYIKASNPTDRDLNLNMKLENIGKFSMDLDIDTQIKSADEFTMKVYVDCEMYKLNKVYFEAANEAVSKGVKKIEFSAKEDNKNILSGSTTYQSRTEGNKFTMEGSGSLKLRDQQKSTSFKYIRDRLTEGQDEGVEVFFNVAVGEKSYVIEHKRTKLVYKLSHSYCEEKKQCAHFNIFRKVDTTDRDRFVTESEVSVDLRKLGFMPEFGLQTKTELDRFRLPTHTFDVHVNLEKSKYHTQVYAKRVKDNYAAAFTVTLPHRVISLESTTSYFDFNSKQQQAFPLVHETSFYTNKLANPKAKTMLRGSVDVKNPTKHEINIISDLVFTNPSLEKDLQITSKTHYNMDTEARTVDMVLDIFKKKEQKIVISGNVTPSISKDKIEGVAKLNVDGRGLGFNILVDEQLLLTRDEAHVDAKAVLEMDKTKKVSSIFMEQKGGKGKLQVKVPSTDIINYEYNFVTTENTPVKVDSSLCIFGGRPLIMGGQISRKPMKLDFQSGLEGSSTLHVTGQIDPSSQAEFTIESVKGKEKNPLVKYVIKIENKTPKSNLQTNAENLQKLIKNMREDYDGIMKNAAAKDHTMREQSTKDFQRIVSLLQAGTPNFDGVSKSINAEMKKIGDELQQDKSLQEFVTTIHKAVSDVTKVVTDITAKVTEIIEKTTQLVTESTSKFVQVFNERIVPEMSAIYEKLSKSALTVMQALVDVASHYIAGLVGVLEKFSEELKPLMESLHGIVNDINKVLMENWETTLELLKSLRQDVEATLTPICSMIEEKWNSPNTTNDLVGAVDMINEFLQSISPTEEVREYLNALTDFVKRVLRKEKVDHWEAIRELVKKSDNALESVVKVVNFADTDDLTPSGMVLPTMLTPGYVYTSGKPGTVSWNVIEMLLNADDIDDLAKETRLHSWNPLDWIPPYKLRGIIAGGQHVFTYDSRHMTFPGNCKYVVSQDAVNGNFSVVMNMAKGAPKSIVLVDKSGSEVEVTTDKKLLFNGSPHGFPLIKADTIAWKEHDSFTIMSNYGVSVKCGWTLDVCFFEASGYYMGKLRGLLGDGNNEPSDDFRMPNGKIAKSEADFGNSYALTPNCPKVKTVDHAEHVGHHAHHTSDICDEYFGDDSDFIYCDMAVNIKNYRQACQHAVTGLKGDEATKEACSIARAYSVACTAAALPIVLPEDCSKCMFHGEELGKGQKMEYETPSKQADIVVAVETTKANEKTFKEMVVPLMNNILGELKNKGVNDVNVILVGVTPKMKYPIYYDIQNNKVQNSKIEFKDEQRATKRESPITTNIKPVDYVLNNLTLAIQQLELELGINNIHLTYTYLSFMRLRPGAMKTMILVNSDPCWESDTELLQTFGVSFTETIMSELGIITHLIAPFSKFAVASKPAATVIGFSDKHVFMLDDKKKAALTNEALRSKMEYADDVCISYAEETYGNVYSSSNYLSLSPEQKKVYLGKVSNTIVGAMQEVETENSCRCVPNIMTSRSDLMCKVKKRDDKRTYGKK